MLSCKAWKHIASMQSLLLLLCMNSSRLPPNLQLALVRGAVRRNGTLSTILAASCVDIWLITSKLSNLLLLFQHCCDLQNHLPPISASHRRDTVTLKSPHLAR